MASPLTVFPLRLLVKLKLDLEAYDGTPSHKLQILVKVPKTHTQVFIDGIPSHKHFRLDLARLGQTL